MVFLDNGVYTLAEVSQLTHVHPARVRSWFIQRADGAGHGQVFEADYQPVGRDRAVSFHDLIDVLVAAQFRDRHNVPMRVVRRAHGILQEELGTKHPFCHSDLYTDGRRIFQNVARLGEDRLSDVISRQQFFLHIREKLDHIDYSQATRLACRWKIARGVVLDPSVNMGRPSIADTGIATFVIASQYYANAENASLVADLYGISETDVLNAVRFEGLYGHRRVA